MRMRHSAALPPCPEADRKAFCLLLMTDFLKKLNTMFSLKVGIAQLILARALIEARMRMVIERERYKGVHRVPGRPTQVDGPDGRRYIAGKLIDNLTKQAPVYDERSKKQQRPRSEFNRDGYLLCDHSTKSGAEKSETIAEAKPWYMQPRQGDDVVRYGQGHSVDDVVRMFKEQSASGKQQAMRQASESAAIVEDEDDEEIFEYDEQAPEIAPPTMFLFRKRGHDRSCKTDMLRVPRSGVVKSSCGTIELLVHANGRSFKPRYNFCGMLTSVSTSDGLHLFRGQKDNHWLMQDSSGNLLEKEQIHTVSFDKKGNLWYETNSGRRVIFFIDGHTETKQMA